MESTVPVYNSFEYTLPGNSLQVFRIKTDSLYQKIEETEAGKEESGIKIVPNPVGDHAQILFDNASEEEFTLCLYDSAGRQVLKWYS